MRSVKPPTRRVSQHPQSLSDPYARLFESDGELLRGITPERAEFYASLLASPALDALFAAGLVQTKRSEVALDGYPLVVEHERIDFVSDWREWPASMLRDATAMVCELCVELSARDLGMLDIHPWNVLYAFSRPVFIDFPAIVPLEHRWLDELAGRFRDYWILPLTLIAGGRPHLARSIRKSCEVTEPLDEFFKRPPALWYPLWYQRLRRQATRDPAKFFRQLAARVRELRLPGDAPQSSPINTFRDDDGLRAFFRQDARAQVVAALLARLKPETLLDVGCGDGRYAMLAESEGCKVVAIDADESRADALYLKTKARGLKILPLLLDFSIPTMGQGRKKEFPSSTARLKCEAVLMLSILERLVFELELSFERVADLLAAYSRRYAVVEFMPPREAFVFQQHGANVARYRLDNFITAMGRYFRLSETFEMEASRKLLVFEKH